MSHKSRRRPSWKKSKMYFRPSVHVLSMGVDNFTSFTIGVWRDFFSSPFNDSKPKKIIVNPQIARLLEGGDNNYSPNKYI